MFMRTWHAARYFAYMHERGALMPVAAIFR